MGVKKSVTRFTLGFNQNDPNHLRVVEILNMKGRQKSKFIVDAILFYENNGFPLMGAEKMDEKTVETIVMRLLGNEETNKLPGFEKKPKTKENLVADYEIAEEIGVVRKNDTDSISRAMTAFRGK